MALRGVTMKKVTVLIPDEDHQAAKEIGEHGFFTRVVRTAIRYYVLGENGSNLLTTDAKEEIDRLKREVRLKREQQLSQEEILKDGFEYVWSLYKAPIASVGVNYLMKDLITAMRKGIYEKYHVVFSTDDMKRAIRENYRRIEPAIRQERLEQYEFLKQMGEELKRKGLT
jgi:hypothetical protein